MLLKLCFLVLKGRVLEPPITDFAVDLTEMALRQAFNGFVLLVARWLGLQLLQAPITAVDEGNDLLEMVVVPPCSNSSSYSYYHHQADYLVPPKQETASASRSSDGLRSPPSEIVCGY